MIINIADFNWKCFDFKIVTLKVQPMSLFYNKGKSHRIIKPKYNEHLSHNSNRQLLNSHLKCISVIVS